MTRLNVIKRITKITFKQSVPTAAPTGEKPYMIMRFFIYENEINVTFEVEM